MPHLGAEMTARPKGKLAKKASFLAKVSDRCPERCYPRTIASHPARSAHPFLSLQTGSQRGFFVPVEEELPQKDTSESPAEGASPTGVGARPPPARTASLLQRIVSHRSGLVSAESTRAKTQSVGLAVVSPDAAAGGRAGNNHERRALALQMSLDQSRRRARRGWVVPQMSGWASEAPPQGTIDHPRLVSIQCVRLDRGLAATPSQPGRAPQEPGEFPVDALAQGAAARPLVPGAVPARHAGCGGQEQAGVGAGSRGGGRPRRRVRTGSHALGGREAGFVWSCRGTGLLQSWALGWCA